MSDITVVKVETEKAPTIIRGDEVAVHAARTGHTHGVPLGERFASREWVSLGFATKQALEDAVLAAAWDPKGEWDAGTAYAPLDAVEHNDAVWVTLGASTGEEPGVAGSWVLVTGVQLDRPNTWTGLNEFDGGLKLPSYTEAALPADAPVGALARVTDGRRGVQVNDPAGWSPLGGRTFYADRHGIVGNGSTSDAAKWQDLVDLVQGEGGGTIVGGGPDKTYLIDSDVLISASHMSIDLQMAKLRGNGRFRFNGDSGVDGDWSNALHFCFFRNAHYPLGGDSEGRGPRFDWCINSGIQNILNEARGGTSFNIHESRRCFVRDVWNTNSRDSGGAIGFLVHMSWDCLLDNCHLYGEDLEGFVYAFQVKGGMNNRVVGCTAKGLRGVTNIFRDRGDAPWKDSGTEGAGHTYPFTDLGWDEADPRRASWNTKWIGCHAEDCEGVGFLAQESVGSTFIGCTAVDIDGIGFSGQRIENQVIDSQERDFAWLGCRAERITGIGRGLSVAGQDASTLLPGIVVDDFHARDAAIGGRISFADSPKVRGVSLENITNIGLSLINNTNDPKVSEIDGKNIDLDLINVGAAVRRPIVRAVTGENVGRAIVFGTPPGSYSDIIPAMWFGETTDATPDDSQARVTFASGEKAWLEAWVHASDGTDDAFIHIAGLYKASGGSVSRIGSLVTVRNERSSGASSWAFTLVAASASTVRARRTGEAGKTITWKITITAKHAGH